MNDNMLTEERYEAILGLLEKKKTVTVTELTAALGTSESTVRRDLAALNRAGRLRKIYGGAAALSPERAMAEQDMKTKNGLHTPEKIVIARHAAGLIKQSDFVYIDAGSTTLHLIDFLTEKNIHYVTNGLPHAMRLAARGFSVLILGGELKSATAAIIGPRAISSLRNYNFTKGFFGANGISLEAGFSTPDSSEGILKREALTHCQKAFVLADSSKFGQVSSVTFADISGADIITDTLPDKKYREYTHIIEGRELM